MQADEHDHENLATSESGRVWAALALAMILPAVAALFYYRVAPGTVVGNGSYIGIKIFLVVWPLVTTAWILREKFRNPLRQWCWNGWIVGLLSGLGMAGILAAMLVDGSPFSELLMESGKTIGDRIGDLGVAKHYLLFAIGISFVHAAVEEFYWRWFVFGQLRRLVPLWAAHLIAAIAFTFHHLVIVSELFPLGAVLVFGVLVGLCGWIWSWIYQRYGCLSSAWISHMVIDLGLMWVGWKALQEA